MTFAAKSEYFTGTRPTDRVVGAYLRATKQLSSGPGRARERRRTCWTLRSAC